EDIRGVLAEGQEVEVAVLKLDWENDRFSFSLKETMADPWDGAASRYYEGSCHTGRVARLTDFGAFVTLEPGIDGLVHISKLGGGRKIHHPREVVQAGESLEVKVESLDLTKRRISLPWPTWKRRKARRPHRPRQRRVNARPPRPPKTGRRSATSSSRPRAPRAWAPWATCSRPGWRRRKSRGTYPGG
ncbi:MAG: S1 RNA-binding domain-containing protein, partial [Desulfobulbaceae bacterium]|nr:S1 RNA-binding domain-containing protein [Desulfobulbaceae bacterium]